MYEFSGCIAVAVQFTALIVIALNTKPDRKEILDWLERI